MATTSASLSITVTSAYAAQTAPDLNHGGMFQWFEAYLTSASVVAFSFDGKNDHGRLDSTNFKSVLRKISGCQKVWFRVVSGTNPATLIASVWQ